MNIWNFTENKLANGNSIYLLINIESNGSSPGRQGFGMAVCSDDRLYGSIGGGIMEYRLVGDCKVMLQGNQHKIFSKKQVHKGSVTDGSGLMCSGEQTVAFIPMNSSDLANIKLITSCINNKETGLLQITQDGYSFNLLEEEREKQYQCSIINENNWIYSEVIGHRNSLYIIGAGHVGYAVSKLFSQLGFKVIVIDNRPKLSMLTDNQYADEKMVIDYKNIADYVVDSDTSYVVIMTNNHTHDKEVLSLLVKKKVKYLGLMGSKEKVAGLMKSMNKSGFTNTELKWVHSPVGVSINSKTPDEIAISIAAEIIGVKNSK